MNKHCYRVIFSKTLQCLVVTSELSKTEGASSSSKMIKKTTALLGENWISDELHASLSKVSFTLFALLGFVLIPDALANDMAIRADKSAPGNQQPIILQTGSGVPQVNIQTPSAGGVSRNVYSQFDVSEKGAVLNNSRKGTGTQIAGYVAGNPNLARGEAKVILNEVNSANPSRLKGYVEVAGKKADVVIANPSGLQCDGCGVINAGRTTLTTGKPIVNNGELSGFEVKDGKISVGAKGMDASHSDYTDIIAKKTKIDGPIKGKQVKVITGKNRVSRDGSDVVYIGDKNDTATTQEYSLDVGELGGMYAGQIHLVDNGKGLGVRNAGHIGASVGDIQIDSQGNIVNSGVMQAEGNIKQKAKRKINNSGTTVSRKGNIKQQADRGIEQSGVLLAKGNRAEQKGNIEQQAAQINQLGNNIATGDIKIKGQQITLDKTSQSIAGIVFESNTVAKTAEKAIERNTEKTATELTEQEIQRLPTLQASGSRVELQADTLTAQGQIIAQQAVVANGNEVNLSHGRIQSYNIEAAAKGSLKADDAVLSAVNQAMLKATNVLSTNETQLTAEQIIANANQLNNNGGQWQQTGNDPLALHFAGGIENRGGHIQTAGALSINTANLNNAQGKLLSAKQATLQGGSVVNADGVIYSAEALSIQTGGLDNSRGHISNKQGDVSINTSKQLLINHQGTIASAAMLSIAAGNTDNKEGVITAEQALSVNADSLNNSRGRLISNGQDIALNIATQLNNQVGTIAAQNVVNINGDLQNNKGVVLSEKGGVRVNSKAQIDNAEGVIQAAQAATLYSQGVDNSKGLIRGASVDIHSQGHQIRNGEGMIAGQSAVNLEGNLHNNKGVVLSEKGGVRVNGKAQIDNAEGVIQAAQAVVLHSQGVDNSKGLIRGASVDIHSQGHQIRNSEGMIAGQSAVNLEGDLHNNKGVVLSEKGGVRVNGKAQIDNAEGVIQAAQAVALNGQGVDNSKGLIKGKNVSLNSEGYQVVNVEGAITALNSITVNGNLNNQRGTLLSEQGDITVNSRSAVNNQQGLIHAATQATINSQGLDNQAGTVSANRLTINSAGQQVNNQQGTIVAQQQLNMTASTLDNREGYVISKGEAQLNLDTVHNQAISDKGSLISANKRLTLNATTVNNQDTKAKEGEHSSQGIIAGTLEMATGLLNNQGGNLYALENARLNVTGDVHNEGGLLYAGNQLDVLGSKQTLIHNQDGLIEGVGGLAVEANNFNDEGTLRSRGLGRIALQIDDYEYNKKFDFGALDFSVNGTLTNNVNAIYDRGVIFRAKNVKNNGTIGAYDKGATQIFATQGVENRGLIDGQFTLVKGETIRNVGQGRIYGDYLAMEAKQIYNGAEKVASGKGTTTRAGTIAGREGLALAFEQMTNADGAAVLSFGNTTIGRTLNEHYQAVGKADSLDNASGLINLMGNARVSVSRLTNRDSHIEDLLAKNNNRISLTQYQQYHAPGQFLVGGDLTLETDKVHNKYSQLLVGGNLTVNGEHIARQGSPLQTNSAHNALNEVLVNEDLSGKVYQLKKAQSNGFRWFKRHHRYKEQTIDNLGLTDNPLATVLGTQTTKYMTDQVNATDATFDNINITGENGQVRIQAQTQLSPEQQQQIVTSGAVVSHYFDSTVQGSLLLNEGKTEISGGKTKGQNGQTEAARRTQLEDLSLTTVRTHLSDNQSLPTASYLQDNRNDPTAPLVSIDPILTKGQHSLNSDYLLKLTGQHSQTKRLGDGFYEQQLVREQINQLTGRRFLEGQTNDQAQYETLMNNGAKAAKELGLEVGKGLTAQQMSNLKQDIVWFVEREVAVPNEGNTLKGGRHREQGETPTTQTVKVLVPQVYTVSRHTDVIDKNAVISATNIIGQLNGKVNNSGAISALNLNQLHAEALENSGRINGRYVDIKTRGDVDNLGGKIEAAKALSVIAGGNINVSSHLKDVHIGDTQKRLIDKVAGLKVRDSDGLLQLVADKDLRFNAATVESAGSLYAKAKDNMVVDSLRMTENTYSGGGDNFRRVRKEQDIGTVIQARDDLTLIGDQSFYAKAAQIVSENGRVHLQSNGDVNIVSGLAIDEEESKSKSKKRRRLGTSKKTTETYNYRYDETALASMVSGKTVSVVGNNIGVTASHLLANQDVIIQGKGRVKIEGELENHAQAYSHSVKKSGLSGSFKRGVLSVHLGTRKQGGGTDGKEQSVAVSSINSLNGNVMVSAGDKITINGSSVAARKNILLSGSDIELGAIYSHGDRSQHSYAKSSGIGVSLTLSPLLAAFDAARNHYKGNAGGGKSIIGKSTTFADSVDEFGQRLTKTLTFSIGGQSHSSENHSSTDNATVSQLRAGGNLILNATRGGIRSEGADFSAEGNFTALAKGDIVFGTAKNQYQANGYEKSHGHGIDTSKSFLKTLTLYKNKATEDAEKTTQKTTALSIGGNSFVKSGGNITTYGTDMAVVGDNIFMADGNITFGSTLEGAAQNRSAKVRGIGSAEISDTERFYGYYQNKESGYFNQRSYKGSVIGSEKGNIQVYAGGNYLQESSALLANAGKVSINAKQVESIAHDNVTLSGNRTSDTKVGGFAKVSSPLIDLFNTATGARDILRDDKAGDRMKAMKGAVLALQGYQAISDLRTGTIARVEVGTGIKHAHADYHEQDIRGQGNIINGAKGIEITAREGYIDLSQIDLATTTYNAQSQKNEVTSGSYVYLDGKRGINLRSGRDEFHAKGRQTGYSMVSGAGAQVGAQTGAYAYAEVGYNNATQQTDNHTKINSHIMTERLIAKTDGDMNLIGASAYADRIETDVKGKLNIVSEQSTAQYNAKGTNVGLRVQVSFGTAWSVGGSYGSNKTRSNYHGVKEQAGLFAGDGGYHVKAKSVNLDGGAIVSTADKSRNYLKAEEFSFKDIHNHSEAKASAMTLIGGFSVNRDQTSAEDKALNKTYRANRKNDDGSDATFTKANPNQHNSSPVKFGLTLGDVHSTDAYALAKLGLVNYLSGSKASESRGNLTPAVISEGVFDISSASGKTAVEQIAKATQSPHQVLSQADYEKLAKKVEISSEFKQTFLTLGASFTDEAYHKMFIAEHRMMGYELDKYGKPIKDPKRLEALKDDAIKDAKEKGITGKEEIEKYVKEYSAKATDKGYNIYKLYELSDEKRKHIEPVTYTDPKTGKQETRYFVAFNGIFNDHQAAAKFAVQNYIAATNPENGKVDQQIYKNMYFVHHPKADNFVSELLIAGYQKWFKSGDNSVKQAEAIMKEYGSKGLFIGAHSRGTLTISNALQRLDSKSNAMSSILSDTKMKMVGPAADVTRADNILNRLQGLGETRQSNKGSILVENHKSDLVGRSPVVGNNPYTTETNTHNKGWIQTIADIFGGDSSSHNCYGLGQQQCVTDGYRKEGDLVMHPEKTIFELNGGK